MWRFLLPAVVMVGALVVLLAGALGNLKSLPDLTKEVPALLASIVPERATSAAGGVTSAAPEPAAPPAVVAQQPTPTAPVGQPGQQPATDALRRQLTDLEAQITQRSQELASLRAGEDQARHALDSLHQQRQTEEATIARLQAEERQTATATPPSTPAPAQAAPVAAQQPAPAAPAKQPAQQSDTEALQRQLAELRAHIAQGSQELASLRTSEDQAHHALDLLHQQRQAEEAAVAQLEAQHRQMAAATPSTPPAQPRPQRQPPQPASAPPQNTGMQTALARLRAKQLAYRGPQQQPTQPVWTPSPQQTLVTARELLASGRTADARQLLLTAQAQAALRPVTPDQPFATGGNVAATRIGDAIRYLDAGNTGNALQAINLAMDSRSESAPAWPSNPPQAPLGYRPPAGPVYSDGNGQD